MNHNYPHISDTKFPDLPTVDVYRYRNEYDYNKYTDSVRIKMMNVSWCGDYDNVVYFETKAERDAWFEAQTGLVKELPTMFRLYNDGTVKVDLPIDECMDYNYVMIDYGKLPSQEHKSDQSKMFYFINNVSQESPNATTLYLSVDYWTTFINDMDISYVNLARGHAPMAETTVDSYLSNPIENSEYLLSSDVNFGDLQRTASTNNIVLNDQDVVLGFLSNAGIGGDWDGRIPTESFYAGSQALNAVDIYIIDTRDFTGFRSAVNEQCPQFWETVKGIFLIPRKVINISTTYTFLGYTFHHVDTVSDKRIADFNITKDKFGYASNISGITKLYTYPYSAIEVNDFKGNVSIIKVEDTIGKLELHTIMCDIYPFLNIEAYMLGMGGSARVSVTFQNVYDNTLNIGGRYYNFSTKWHIPVFAVQLSVEENWALNKKLGADASKANAYATADNLIANTALSNQLRSDNNADSVTRVNTIAANNVTKMNNDRFQSSSLASFGASLDIDQAAIAGFSSSVGALSNNAVGAAATTAMNTVVGMVKNDAWANANVEANRMFYEYAASNINANTAAEVAYMNDVTSQTNSTNTATTANTASTQKGNADRSYNAQYAQTLLTNPPMHGNMTGTPDIVSKPFGLSYNIVTQSKNAIRQAAEQFLRYGYMLNMEWNIDTFNKMPKFTYWECDKVYCNDNGVYEGAQDMIKSILNQGTTVWRNPEEIGLVSIYTNI